MAVLGTYSDGANRLQALSASHGLQVHQYRLGIFQPRYLLLHIPLMHAPERQKLA